MSTYAVRGRSGQSPLLDELLAESDRVSPLSEPLVRAEMLWRLAAGESLLPARRDMDALLPPELAAAAVEYDVMENPLRLRHRWIGADVLPEGRMITPGAWLEGFISPRLVENVHNQYVQVMLERSPLCHQGFLWCGGRDTVVFKRLLLPLGADGENVTSILAVFDLSAVQEGTPARRVLAAV